MFRASKVYWTKQSDAQLSSDKKKDVKIYLKGLNMKLGAYKRDMSDICIKISFKRLYIVLVRLVFTAE